MSVILALRELSGGELWMMRQEVGQEVGRPRLASSQIAPAWALCLRGTRPEAPRGSAPSPGAHRGSCHRQCQYTFETAVALASCGVDGNVFTAMHLQPAELPKQRIGFACCGEWRTCSHWAWGFPKGDGIWAADWASSLKTVKSDACIPAADVVVGVVACTLSCQ